MRSSPLSPAESESDSDTSSDDESANVLGFDCELCDMCPLLDVARSGYSGVALFSNNEFRLSCKLSWGVRSRDLRSGGPAVGSPVD